MEPLCPAAREAAALRTPSFIAEPAGICISPGEPFLFLFFFSLPFPLDVTYSQKVKGFPRFLSS